MRDLDKYGKYVIQAKIKKLSTNATAMEQKMAYLAEDLETVKLKLYGVPNPPVGVNDTVVDWSKHPGAWLPTFELLEGEVQMEPESDDDDDGLDLPSADMPDEDENGDADAEGEATMAAKAAAGRGHKQRRLKKCKAQLKYQQLRLAAIWGQMGYLTGNVTMLNDYMAHRPRSLGGILVLAHMGEEEEEPVLIEARGRAGTSRRRPTEPEEEEEQPKQPEEEMDDLLEEAWDTADTLWESFGSIGMQVEALKRRASMWVRATPPMQYAYSEDLPGAGVPV